MNLRTTLPFSGALSLAVLGTFATTAPASAQYLPGGSYAQSCQHIYMDGPNLNAECRSLDGGFRYTRIFAPRCAGYGVSNHNGVLSCGAY